MKSNKLLFAAIGLMALTMSSCSEELETPTVNGDGNVVFTAQLPDGINSRAFNDGEKAKVLKYAVYETGTKTVIYSSDQTDAPKATYNNMTFTLSLPLVKGQTYDLVFWAESETADSATSPYTFTPSDQTIKINYDGIKCNDESRDAFFTSVTDFTVTGASQQSVQLYRPFAQLNIGTNDLTVADRAGIKHKTTKVVVKDVYKTLNLLDGKASDEAEVTFDHAERPTSESFPVATYDYLAMNYLLTGSVPVENDVNNAQKETKDITIFFNDEDANEINKFNLSAVPFQRNYRTNIYGALLTSTVDYTIEVVPGFNDDAHTVEFDKDGFRIATSLDEAKTLLAKGEPAVSLNGELLTAETTSRAGENLVEFILNKATAHQKLKITGEAKAGISVKYDESQATVTTPKFTLVITKSLPAVSVNLPTGEVEIVGASETADEKAQLPAVTITNAASTAITGDVTVESVTKGEDYAGDITFDGAVEITVDTTELFLNALTNEDVEKINVTADLNLIETTVEQLTVAGIKTINVDENVTITLGNDNHFSISNDFNLTGKGTITNEYENDNPAIGTGKTLICVYDGNFSAREITLINDREHFYHGPELNGSAIIYWGTANVKLEKTKIYSGMFCICGYNRSTSQSITNFNECYFWSCSSSSYGTGNWAYAVRICGKKSTLTNCTIEGIQGCLSPEWGVEMTIDGGRYETRWLDAEKKTGNPYDAIYVTNLAQVTVLDGYFYGPKTDKLAEGTECIRSGDNDVNYPDGTIYLKGGKFSGKAYNHETKTVIEPTQGFEYVANTDSDSDRYPWTVKAKATN